MIGARRASPSNLDLDRGRRLLIQAGVDRARDGVRAQGSVVAIDTETCLDDVDLAPIRQDVSRGRGCGVVAGTDKHAGLWRRRNGARQPATAIGILDLRNQMQANVLVGRQVIDTIRTRRQRGLTGTK